MPIAFEGVVETFFFLVAHYNSFRFMVAYLLRVVYYRSPSYFDFCNHNALLRYKKN